MTAPRIDSPPHRVTFEMFTPVPTKGDVTPNTPAIEPLSLERAEHLIKGNGGNH
jgi:hypothetical protein